MKKSVAGLFVSLDGAVEMPDKWTGPFFVSEVGEHVGSMTGGGDTMLLGPITYETFAASFAGQSGGLADQMNSFPKVVDDTKIACGRFLMHRVQRFAEAECYGVVALFDVTDSSAITTAVRQSADRRSAERTQQSCCC